MADERSPDPPALPASVELLWRRREPSRRGPKPAFSIDEVIAAAIEVADAEGLSAVSMARVAQQLGSSTMALYRYVASKDDLLLLMSDAAIGPPPAIRGRRRWRKRVEQWALAVRGVWTRRPWLLMIPVNGPPAGPNNLLWFDAFLAALEGTGLNDGDKVGAALLVSTYLRGEVLLTLDVAAATATDPSSVVLNYGAMAGLLEPARYPALAEMIATGAFEGEGPDDADFTFGLDVILDGIAARIARTARST